MTDDRVTVLYIGGYSRSGSTLLQRLLSRMDGFIAVGELWDIWQRSFAEDQLCGCGRPFRTCDFWQAVIGEAFGGFDRVDEKTQQALRASVQSNRHIPFLTMPSLRTPGYRSRLQTYVRTLDDLYRGISRVSGGQIIIDSSKVPTYAFVLKEAPGIDLRLLHLVRDSRATAYSWQRKKLRPEIYWKTTYMDRYSPGRSALEWTVMNGLVHLLQRAGVRYSRLRYEDLVSDPDAAINEVIRQLDLKSPEKRAIEAGRSVHFDIDHTVSGNPNRFQKGRIKVQPDHEWQEKLSRLHRGIVTTLTWPLLSRYGYHQRASVAVGGSPDGPIAVESVRTDPSKVTDVRKPRILLATARYLPHVGGTEIHTYELARRFVSAGYDTTVLTTDLTGRLPEEDHLAGANVIRVRAWPKRTDFFFAPGIYRRIVDGHWDLIHCQGYHTFVAPLVMLAARRANIPYVVTFHSGGHSSRLRNFFRPLQRAFLRPLLARANGLIAVSSWESEYFKKRLRLPAERFTVIPNGSYLRKSDTVPRIRQDGTLIVSVGRLEQYKGHHRVIAALPILAEQIPDIRLRIIGSGPYEKQLWQFARQYGVVDRVDIRAIPGEDRAEMAAVVMGAALVILLSNYESHGISVMEALSLGRPVLVADSTALSELAASGLARATPLGGTADEIATAILGQLHQPLIPDNPELPTWEACANKVLEVYRKTVLAGI